MLESFEYRNLLHDLVDFVLCPPPAINLKPTTISQFAAYFRNASQPTTTLLFDNLDPDSVHIFYVPIIRQMICIRHQWRHFRWLLGIGPIGSWAVCTTGILLLDKKNFVFHIAFLVMIVLCTPTSVYLYLCSRKEVRVLHKEAMKIPTQQPEEPDAPKP